MWRFDFAIDDCDFAFVLKEKEKLGFGVNEPKQVCKCKCASERGCLEMIHNEQ